ncbi:MAG: hypothetical protein JNJ75_10670 [Cyclobacteriaceae bacterium]|nr:hypothetical protein [Cyclobacteriaceae bacterium]
MIKVFTFSSARVVLLVLLAILCSDIYAQRVLQLTKVSNGKKIILKEGYRVVYILQGNTSRNKGVIDKINESSVTIGGYDFLLSEFKAIGRKRKGSGFWSASSATLGTMFIVGAIQASQAEDPCPDCSDEGSTGEGWTAVEIGIGAALVGLSINTTTRNSPRDVVKKWKLEIIDQP